MAFAIPPLFYLAERLLPGGCGVIVERVNCAGCENRPSATGAVWGMATDEVRITSCCLFADLSPLFADC
jgi:hypothetical protein